MDDLTVDAEDVVSEYQSLLSDAQYRIIVLTKFVEKLRAENRDLKQFLAANENA